MAEKTKQVVLTFKDTKGFKEALRKAAFAAGHSSSSQVISESLEANPLVAKYLKKKLRNN